MTAQAPVPTVGGAATQADDGGTIQLSEETLSVGKRVMNRGTTRIRRFVVETPVEQNVSLLDERVTIERRPVTDGRAVSGEKFTDKTIEMTETGEEAVICKTARVIEEIAIKKNATDRTETVRDMVRREEVEIVKVPSETAGTAYDTSRANPSFSELRLCGGPVCALRAGPLGRRESQQFSGRR